MNNLPPHYSCMCPSVNHEKNTVVWFWFCLGQIDIDILIIFIIDLLENLITVNMKLTQLPHKAHDESTAMQRHTIHTQGNIVLPLHMEARYT